MSSDYRKRLDPDDGVGNLMRALLPLATPEAAPFRRLFSIDEEMADHLRELGDEYEQLVAAPERVAGHLADLGWIAGPGPIAEYV